MSKGLLDGCNPVINRYRGWMYYSTKLTDNGNIETWDLAIENTEGVNSEQIEGIHSKQHCYI